MPSLAYAILKFIWASILWKCCLRMFYGVTCYAFRGASLCAGNLHPDAVIHHGKCLKTSKKSYYSGLQKYHNGYVIWRSYHFLCFISMLCSFLFLWPNWRVANILCFSWQHGWKFTAVEGKMGKLQRSRGNSGPDMEVNTQDVSHFLSNCIVWHK